MLRHEHYPLARAITHAASTCQSSKDLFCGDSCPLFHPITFVSYADTSKSRGRPLSFGASVRNRTPQAKASVRSLPVPPMPPLPHSADGYFFVMTSRES